jgi:hypothetical protein
MNDSKRLHFVTIRHAAGNSIVAEFGVPQIQGGLPIMQTVLDQPTAQPDGRPRPQAADEERELALLSQFMRHDSVASLANAIAERLGGSARGGDLIAAAGLGLGGGGRCASSDEILVNPDAGLRR